MQSEARFSPSPHIFSHLFKSAGMAQLFAEFGYTPAVLGGTSFPRMMLSQFEEGNLIAAAELDFDVFGVLAFNTISAASDIPTLNCLLENGFDFDLKDRYFCYSQEFGNGEYLSLLHNIKMSRKFEFFLTLLERLEATAQPNSEVRIDFLTRFLRSPDSLSIDSTDIISFLLTQGANVNYRNPDNGYSLLQMAFANKSEDFEVLDKIFPIFLGFGVDVNHTDDATHAYR